MRMETDHREKMVVDDDDDDNQSDVESDNNDDDDDDDDMEEDDNPKENDDDDESEENDMETSNVLGASLVQVRGADDPFLNSFYGLSSTIPNERTRCGQYILYHCFYQPTTKYNIIDLSYTFKRLCNGLCSGRAGSRQGMASTLCSYLQLITSTTVSTTTTTIEDGCCTYLSAIRQHEEEKNTTTSQTSTKMSDLAYVRQRLLAATEWKQTNDNNQNNFNSNNKKRPKHGRGGGGGVTGSEERDYQFGRLFGINAIIRSGILVPLQQHPKTTTTTSPEMDDDTTTIKKSNDQQDLVNVIRSYVQDLIDLYHVKKWMREPAAHAIVTILNTYYDGCCSSTTTTTTNEKRTTKSTTTTSGQSNNDDNISYQVINTIVPKVIVPGLLSVGDNQSSLLSSSSSSLIGTLYPTYSAEQIAVAITIQSNLVHHHQTHNHDNDEEQDPIWLFLQSTLVLNNEMIPLIAPALSETSCVVQPRTHLVWDVLFHHVTSSYPNSQHKSGGGGGGGGNHKSTFVDWRMGRTTITLPQHATSTGTGTPSKFTTTAATMETQVEDIIHGIVQHVIMERLLGMEMDHDGSIDQSHPNNKQQAQQALGKTTHERRALALCLLRNGSGIEYVSSVHGRTRIVFSGSILENILYQPLMIKRLFLDIICTGTHSSGGNNNNNNNTNTNKKNPNKQQAAHLLKPLALQILESLIPAVTMGLVPKEKHDFIPNELIEGGGYNNGLSRALGLVRAILRCEPRFDSRTKTNTILSIVQTGFNYNNNNEQQLTTTKENKKSITNDVNNNNEFFTEFLLFVKKQIVSVSSQGPTMDNNNMNESSIITEVVSSTTAVGYIDLLFQISKELLKQQQQQQSDQESKNIVVDDDDESNHKKKENHNSNNNNQDHVRHDVIQHILHYFMLVAFYDCQSITSPMTLDTIDQNDNVTKSGKKKPKKNKSNAVSLTKSDTDLLELAFFIKDTRGGVTKTTSDIGAVFVVPHDVRTVVSARFYSLLSSYVGTIAYSLSAGKNKRILDVLTQLNITCTQIEKWGAKRLASNTSSSSDGKMDTKDGDDDDDDEEENPLDIVNKLQHEAQQDIPVDATKEKRAGQQFAVSFASLASTLYLHLLSCGRTEMEPDDDDMDADDDDDHEEIISLLTDVHHVYQLFTGTKDASDDDDDDSDDDKGNKHELRALAELCTNILSSPIGTGNQSRGASPTLLRDMVKTAWTTGLTFAAVSHQDSSELMTLDQNVVNILLNAIGAIDRDGDNAQEVDDDEEDADNDSMNVDDDEDEKDDSDTEKNVFQSSEAKHIANDDSDSDIPLNKSKMNTTDMDEEIELNAEGLQSLLEEGSDVDVDEKELEHHAGADAALARLIQVKQEARKAGQLALERAELSRQLRCVVLLECLAVGKSDSWGSLFRVDVVLHAMVPVIQYRRELMKSLEKATDKGSTTGQAEKRALTDRLTSLLKTKLFKTKIVDHQWNNDVDVLDFCSDFATTLLREVRNAVDKEHATICNSALMFMIRNVPDSKKRLECSKFYADAVTDWSMKRTKSMDVSFFETLIHHYPVLAQACLSTSLVNASTNAKTPFLKVEAFRLLALLFNSKLNSNDPDLDKLAFKSLMEATDPLLDGISKALMDSDTQKTKRVKEILKVISKVFMFEEIARSITSVRTEQLKDALENIRSHTESDAVKQMVEKLMKTIDTMKNHKTVDNTKRKGNKSNVAVVASAVNENKDDDDNDEVLESKMNDSNEKKTSSSPSKSNKKKKSKKSKR